MTRRRFTLEEINEMPETQFVATFGDVAESSPWVAEQIAPRRPFPTRRSVIAAFEDEIRRAPEAKRLALLRVHPDLAGRAAVAGTIGEVSRAEQAGAGLDRLTHAEYDRFSELNDAYRRRFGFPFILAARGATKHDILAAFEARIGNDPARELDTVVAQVCRIVRFRLEDRIMEKSS